MSKNLIKNGKDLKAELKRVSACAEYQAFFALLNDTDSIEEIFKHICMKLSPDGARWAREKLENSLTKDQLELLTKSTLRSAEQAYFLWVSTKAKLSEVERQQTFDVWSKEYPARLKELD